MDPAHITAFLPEDAEHQLKGSVVVPRLLTPREAGEVIDKSEKWLEADRRNGPTIPYVKLGRSVRYRAEVLRDVVLRHEVKAAS